MREGGKEEGGKEGMRKSVRSVVQAVQTFLLPSFSPSHD
jgi:hypothetical protein